MKKSGFIPRISHNCFLSLVLIYDLLHSTGQDLQLPRGKGHKRTSRSQMKVPHLTHTPHSHTKDSHSTGITLLFSNSAWVLLRPVELSTFKELWDGTSGLLSLSEKTRKSNHLEMKLQRQNFLLSYLKTLTVGQVGVSNSHDLPLHSPVHNQMTVQFSLHRPPSEMMWLAVEQLL